MKAFRNIAGQVTEIDIDLDLNGNPILPPDTTVDARPVALDGHYVTVVDKAWVQIPVPVQTVSLEALKAEKLAALSAYRAWYMDQPVLHDAILFDGDETARARLSQTVIVTIAGAQVPPAWITYDNNAYPLVDVEALKALTVSVFTAFGTRFFEVVAIREAIDLAANEAALAEVVVPAIPGPF